LKSKLDAIGVPLVPIVVPAPQERIKAIIASGGGFVYLMMGPAENETAFVNQLNDFAKQVKQITNLPLCLGIELRDPILAKKLTKDADNIDGILVGDVLMETIQRTSNNGEFGQLTDELTRVVEDFSTSLVLRT
jgi:tryptophan synthase alpha chain